MWLVSVTIQGIAFLQIFTEEFIFTEEKQDYALLCLVLHCILRF